MRLVMEKAMEFNKPAFLCDIDFIKAFDLVPLRDVISLLEKNNVPLQMIKVILDIHIMNTKTKCKCEEN